MTNRIVLMVVALTLFFCGPSHAFLDYLFSGSGSRDAIDNSAVGDLRAWWSGNPVYNFNPYYSGSATMGQQQQVQQQQQAMPQASINYVPGGQQGGGYDSAQQPGSYGYQGYSPGGGYQQAPQGMYGQAQPSFQPAPQQYYPTQPQAQPVYQIPQQQQYAPMGGAPQGYQTQPGAYQ
ncbi:MAG: hypothetical protein AB7V04_08675 [Desulfomonilaceae bacterium]